MIVNRILFMLGISTCQVVDLFGLGAACQLVDKLKSLEKL